MDANSHLLLGDGLSEIAAQTRLFDGVDLLTLSACSTAFTNRSEDGREVDSLGTIAQRLGAKGVIASLWSVNDQATARSWRRCTVSSSRIRTWASRKRCGGSRSECSPAR